jgi:putative Holliday junction resolvase
MKTLEALQASHGFDTVVLGQPFRLGGELSVLENHIAQAIVRIRERFPSVAIERVDERYTSKIAADTMIAAGARKKQRRDKATVDKISATLILQEYLNARN